MLQGWQKKSASRSIGGSATDFRRDGSGYLWAQQVVDEFMRERGVFAFTQDRANVCIKAKPSLGYAKFSLSAHSLWRLAPLVSTSARPKRLRLQPDHVLLRSVGAQKRFLFLSQVTRRSKLHAVGGVDRVALALQTDCKHFGRIVEHRHTAMIGIGPDRAPGERSRFGGVGVQNARCAVHIGTEKASAGSHSGERKSGSRLPRFGRRA